MPSITLESSTRIEMIDITERIARLVKEQAVESGYVIVFVPHTSAGITINEHFDPDVKHDLLQKLQTLVPQIENYYLHDEGNSDAHVKSSLVGSSVTVLIEGGKLLLGRWQGIFFCEFDGPRERKMHVKVVATPN